MSRIVNLVAIAARPESTGRTEVPLVLPGSSWFFLVPAGQAIHAVRAFPGLVGFRCVSEFWRSGLLSHSGSGRSNLSGDGCVGKESLDSIVAHLSKSLTVPI